MDNRRSFGQFLRSRRESMGLTQRELADRCNLHQHTICGLETNRTRPDNDSIRSLASGIGMTFAEVFVECAEGRADYVKRGYATGDENGNCKLTDDQVLKVRNKWLDGSMTFVDLQKWIAEKLGVDVSHSYVSLLIRGKRR